MGSLVSVIMPCYRASSEHLETSLKSILSQSYDNLELIVVNDPSTPELDRDLRGTLEGFKDDKRLKMVLHRCRMGLVNSLNEGIMISNGEYIARADADDVSLPSRIEEQTNFLREGNCSMVGSWGLLVNEDDGSVISTIRKPVASSEIRSKMMLHNPFLHSTVMIEKRIFKDVGLYDSRFQYTEDYELWLRIVSKGYSCANLPRYLVLIRETRMSVTRGAGWAHNRFAYLKCKMYAHREYRFNTFRDDLYLAMTPIALVTHPNAVTALRKVLDRLRI